MHLLKILMWRLVVKDWWANMQLSGCKIIFDCTVRLGLHLAGYIYQTITREINCVEFTRIRWNLNENGMSNTINSQDCGN